MPFPKTCNAIASPMQVIFDTALHTPPLLLHGPNDWSVPPRSLINSYHLSPMPRPVAILPVPFSSVDGFRLGSQWKFRLLEKAGRQPTPLRINLHLTNDLKQKAEAGILWILRANQDAVDQDQSHVLSNSGRGHRRQRSELVKDPLHKTIIITTTIIIIIKISENIHPEDISSFLSFSPSS